MNRIRKIEEKYRREALSQNVFRLMREHNINQSDLSRSTGIPQPAISRMLSLISNPRVTVVQELAEFFDVSMDELLRRKRNEQ